MPHFKVTICSISLQKNQAVQKIKKAFRGVKCVILTLRPPLSLKISDETFVIIHLVAASFTKHLFLL